MMCLEFFSQYFSELINTSMKRGITMDKPSLTNRPDKPVIPKKEAKGITITVDMDTDKMQLKLRAIAKHTTALADELDGIDKGIGCDNCGSYYVYETRPERLACGNCGSQFHISNAMLYNESPTRLEGSE